MNILNTLKTNYRDIIAGLVLTLGLAFLADALERMATTNDGHVWLANVVTSLRGLAAFGGANLAAFIMIAVAWPTLNKYSNDSFLHGWNSLSPPQRFAAFIAIAMCYLISAALCFAP